MSELDPAPGSAPGEPAAPAAPPAPGLELAATLARGVGAALRALPRALPIVLPAVAVAQLPTMLAGQDFAFDPSHGASAPDLALADWLVIAGVLLFDVTLGTWAQAAAFLATEAALEGEPVPDFAHAYARSLDRVPAAIGATLVVALALFTGTLCCIVPGALALALLSFAVMRTIVRGEGVRLALEHSALLARRRVWRILGALAMMAFVLMPLVVLSGLVEVAITGGHTPSDTVSRLPVFALTVATGSLVMLLVMGMQLALHQRLEQLGPKA